MFYDIYPVTQGEDFEIVFARLSEELGELAECVRVLEILPTAFLSEAADVFAWLMKLANLYDDKKNSHLDLNVLLAGVYPDRCNECKNRVCTCPPILPSTVTRIAHEGPPVDLLAERWPFFTPAEKIARFDVGAKQIHVGIRSFGVTGTLIEQVFVLSRDLQALIRTTEGVSPELRSRVEQWATTMMGLATGQRVSQKVVDELLLTIRAADELTKLVVCRLLHAAAVSPLRDALLEDIVSASAVTSSTA